MPLRSRPFSRSFMVASMSAWACRSARPCAGPVPGTITVFASTTPSKEFDAKWGDPKQFLVNAYRGLWGHVRELGGIV